MTHEKTASTDRIEKSIVLRAPRARVWRALSNAEEFGRWFGADLAGQRFAAGGRARGRITYPGYEHLTLDIEIDRMEPERLLSWRWHPGAVDAAKVAHEPPTEVVFELRDHPEGTLLSVVESGFDRLPPGRRDEAWRQNEEGWTGQMENIGRHVRTP